MFVQTFLDRTQHCNNIENPTLSEIAKINENNQAPPKIFDINQREKREEIWLSPVTKTPTPTEQSKKQRDNIKTPPKTLITQLLRTDLGRSVGVTAVTQLVWLNQFTSAQPSH